MGGTIEIKDFIRNTGLNENDQDYDDTRLIDVDQKT
jgi:hypothetical protein